MNEPIDNKRRDCREVDGRRILDKLAGLRIESWNYKFDDPKIRHIGPMAQDFAAAFGLADDARTINFGDAIGVAFAAIKELDALLDERDRQIAALREGLTEIREALARIRRA